MSAWLADRHVVITGGGTGLGAALASAFQASAPGVRLTLMGRNESRLDATAAQVRAAGGHANPIVCDVTDEAGVTRAFVEAVRLSGAADVLINNAGHAPAAAFLDTTIGEWQQTIATNLTGTMMCSQQVLPAMIEAGEGRIINMASTAGLRGFANVTAYCAAKHGVVGLTRALAAELSRTGVTVNAVCPGYVEGTPMMEQAVENVMRATGKSREDARTALGKPSGGVFATVDAVTGTVLKLCSADARSITGQALLVGGGEVTE